MSNDKTTVRFAYAATNGETTRARDFDGVDTITVPTARLRELYAELARLERSRDFYQVRVAELQNLLLKMPEPWATLCADIVANGFPRYWGIGESLPDQPDVARLERRIEVAEAIMREVGSKVSPRLVEAWREAGNAAS